MIQCLNFDDARLTAINILSRDGVFIKNLSITCDDKDKYWIDYEEFDQDTIFNKILT